jgi:hypothetical protein
MATTKTDAQKVAELRKQAMDKSLPQEVRDMADKKANEIEGKSVEKSTGMKLAKGGAVAKKAAPKKFAMGGVVAKPGSPRIVAKPAQNRFVGASSTTAPQAVTPKMAQPPKKPQMEIPTTGSKTSKMATGAPQAAFPAPYAKGGAVAKELPMRGQRTATNMAKGGAVKKAKGK